MGIATSIAWRHLALLAASVTLSPACGRGDGKTPPPPPVALADGIYDLTPFVCVSTSALPSYPAANYRVALAAYAELTEQSLVVRGAEADFVHADADCRVTETRIVQRNASSAFSVRIARKLTFEPEGCLLTVTHGTQRLEVGRGYGSQLEDSDDQGEELPFVIEAVPEDPARFTMTSADTPEISTIWAAYGCASLDRIQRTLKMRL